MATLIVIQVSTAFFATTLLLVATHYFKLQSMEFGGLPFSNTIVPAFPDPINKGLALPKGLSVH